MKKCIFLLTLVVLPTRFIFSQSFTLTDTTFAVKDTLAEVIDFDYNEAVILPQSFPFLDQLADVLFKHSYLKIEVGNFIDFRGIDAYNFKLTKQRAQAIVNYLISKGIDASRLVPMGYGERKQVYSEQKVSSEKVWEFKTNMLRANCRTEFKVLSVNFKL